MKLFICLLSIVVLSGCAIAPQQGGVPATQSVAYYEPPQTDSLFTSDAAVLSDADIKRILDFHYTLPAPAKLAILPLGQEQWFGFSDELARSGENIRSRFVRTLKQAPGVTSAAFLPSLLVPQERTVAYLREAAARYQSDLLLVYQASCRTYEKYRFFSANQSKSFCTVEALLLDVRTGIVPFTTTSTDEFRVEQNSSDSNIYETRRRAELSAINRALTQVGIATFAYLKKP